MIIFDLSCNLNHCFEGWFRNADDFNLQLNSERIACPQCSSTTIRRIPSAVSISSSHTERDKVSVAPSNRVQAGRVPPSETQMKAMVRQVVNTLISSSEDVGSDFTVEARKIHYKQAPDRSIRGQASADDVEALIDEGIPVVNLPNIKSEDLN